MFRTAAILLALLATPTVASAQEAGETVISIHETETTTIEVDSDGEIIESTDRYGTAPESAEHEPDKPAQAGKRHRFNPKPGYGFMPSGKYGIKQYEQGQDPWGQRPFGGMTGKKTMAASGCGPTALAMVGATLTGNTKKYTPDRVAYHYRWVYGDRVNWFTPGGRDAMSQAGNWMGLRTRRIGRDLALAATTLKQGGMVIGLFGPSYYTKAGHYMVILPGFKVVNPNQSQHEGEQVTAAQLLNRGLLQLWSFRRAS